MTENIKYIVVEKTLKELIDIVNKDNDYGGPSDRTELYECQFDRKNLTETQQKLQENNRWCTERKADMHISDFQLRDMLESVLYDKILNGCKKNLPDVVFSEIMNAKVVATICLEYEVDKYTGICFNCGFENDKDTLAKYSTDIKELEEKMKSVKRKVSLFSKDNDRPEVYLEKVSVGIYYYGFRSIEEKLKKMIKKFIHENLTYCIKKNEIIIPDEYLAKGKSGIEEWREFKKSKNKNNSMEKRMLKQIQLEKKQYAFSCSYKVMSAITSRNYTWNIPSMAIEGRFNKQRVGKLINNLLKENKKENLVDVSEQDIFNMIKDYWKKILADACVAIEECTMEDKKN